MDVSVEMLLIEDHIQTRVQLHCNNLHGESAERCGAQLYFSQNKESRRGGTTERMQGASLIRWSQIRSEGAPQKTIGSSIIHALNKIVSANGSV